jgi:hypothetical protein
MINGLISSELIFLAVDSDQIKNMQRAKSMKKKYFIVNVFLFSITPPA